MRSTANPPRCAAFPEARFWLALLLLIAAGLKTHQLATEPVGLAGLSEPRWFLLALIEFELFMGVWVASGLLRTAAWWAAIVVFSSFAGVAAWKGLSGETSCGCFGRVHTSPWVALGIDLSCVGSLLWRRSRALPAVPQNYSSQPNGIEKQVHWFDWSNGFAKKYAMWLATWLVAAISVGALAAAGARRDAVTAFGDRFADVMVVKPERMVGHWFQLGKYIDIGARLADGPWLVVFYRVGCPDCERLMADWPEIGARPVDEARLAFVSVPPHGDSVVPTSTAALPGIVWGRLTEDFEWFVRTPLVVTLVDNRVMAVQSLQGVIQSAARHDDLDDGTRALGATGKQLPDFSTGRAPVASVWKRKRTT